MKARLWYILPVILMVNISTVFAEPVCMPSFQKEVPPIPRQSISELSDSHLQCLEFGLQDVNDMSFIYRPLSWLGIEVSKLSENGGAEFLANSYTPGLFLAPVSEAMVAKDSDKNSNQSYQCNGYCTFYITLPLWIMAYATAFGFGCTTFDIRGAL